MFELKFGNQIDRNRSICRFFLVYLIHFNGCLWIVLCSNSINQNQVLFPYNMIRSVKLSNRFVREPFLQQQEFRWNSHHNHHHHHHNLNPFQYGSSSLIESNNPIVSQSPRTILIETIERPQPINLIFRSLSSQLNLIQDHQESNDEESNEREHYELIKNERPIRMILNITKPIIQEVNEMIVPIRNIRQQIQPIQEFIETKVMREQFGFEANHFAVRNPNEHHHRQQQQQQHGDVNEDDGSEELNSNDESNSTSNNNNIDGSHHNESGDVNPNNQNATIVQGVNHYDADDRILKHSNLMNTKFEIEKSRLRSPSLSPSSTLSYWWNESDKMMILNDGDESKSNPFRETKRSNTDHNDGDLNHLDRDRKTNEIDLQQYVDFIHNLQQRQQQSQTNLLSTSRFDRKSFINIERIDEEDGPNVTRTMIQTDLYRHRNHLENDNSSGDDKDEIISTNLDNQIQMRIDELNPTTESHSNGSTMIENLVQSNQSKDFDNDLDTVVGVSDENLLFVLQKQSPNSISDETKHENSIGEKNFEDNKNVSDDNHHHHHHHHRRKQPIINNYEERNNDSNDHNDNGRDVRNHPPSSIIEQR